MQLRHLRYEAHLKMFQFGEDAYDGQVAVAYDAGWGWKVRVVPKYDVKINIWEDRIQIAFSPFEEEIEVKDFILPLLEIETYRERSVGC